MSLLRPIATAHRWHKARSPLTIARAAMAFLILGSYQASPRFRQATISCLMARCDAQEYHQAPAMPARAMAPCSTPSVAC
jgi:hypothetical protein